ncbi:unnamed protein product [Nezara viridula]|uniref:Uncharacterized protein n=1 Tax=Nezara viridula TaxID=85310 RepID=A0A9P0EA48_NEZVI|nr:unnamed protein product [Nezara viridula]
MQLTGKSEPNTIKQLLAEAEGEVLKGKMKKSVVDEVSSRDNYKVDRRWTDGPMVIESSGCGWRCGNRGRQSCVEGSISIYPSRLQYSTSSPPLLQIYSSMFVYPTP